MRSVLTVTLAAYVAVHHVVWEPREVPGTDFVDEVDMACSPAAEVGMAVELPILVTFLVAQQATLGSAMSMWARMSFVVASANWATQFELPKVSAARLAAMNAAVTVFVPAILLHLGCHAVALSAWARPKDADTWLLVGARAAALVKECIGATLVVATSCSCDPGTWQLQFLAMWIAALAFVQNIGLTVYTHFCMLEQKTAAAHRQDVATHLCRQWLSISPFAFVCVLAGLPICFADSMLVVQTSVDRQRRTGDMADDRLDRGAWVLHPRARACNTLSIALAALLLQVPFAQLREGIAVGRRLMRRFVAISIWCGMRCSLQHLGSRVLAALARKRSALFKYCAMVRNVFAEVSDQPTPNVHGIAKTCGGKLGSFSMARQWATRGSSSKGSPRSPRAPLRGAQGARAFGKVVASSQASTSSGPRARVAPHSNSRRPVQPVPEFTGTSKKAHNCSRFASLPRGSSILPGLPTHTHPANVAGQPLQVAAEASVEVMEPKVSEMSPTIPSLALDTSADTQCQAVAVGNAVAGEFAAEDTDVFLTNSKCNEKLVSSPLGLSQTVVSRPTGNEADLNSSAETDAVAKCPQSLPGPVASVSAAQKTAQAQPPERPHVCDTTVLRCFGRDADNELNVDVVAPHAEQVAVKTPVVRTRSPELRKENVRPASHDAGQRGRVAKAHIKETKAAGGGEPLRALSQQPSGFQKSNAGLPFCAKPAGKGESAAAQTEIFVDPEFVVEVPPKGSNSKQRTQRSSRGSASQVDIAERGAVAVGATIQTGEKASASPAVVRPRRHSCDGAPVSARRLLEDHGDSSHQQLMRTLQRRRSAIQALRAAGWADGNYASVSALLQRGELDPGVADWAYSAMRAGM